MIKVRIFTLLGISLLLALLFSQVSFVTSEMPDKQRVLTISSRQEDYQAIPKDDSMSSLLKQILAVFFDIDTERLGLLYEACFVNNGTKIIYPDGREDTSVKAFILFNNQTEFIVPYKDKRCIIYEPDKNFTYRWYFKFNMSISKPHLIPQEQIGSSDNIYSTQFIPDTYSFPRMETLSFWRLYFYLLLLILGAILFFSGTIKLIRRGFW